MGKTVRIPFRDYSKGLYLSAAPDEIPAGSAIRNRGIHPLSRGLFRIRNGSAQLYDVDNAHSLAYYNDTWYIAASTYLYETDDIIKTGLSGDRLSFTRMPPVAGVADYLFVAGGDDLFKVSDHNYLSGTELITNGDMEDDDNWSDYGTPAANARSSTQANGGTYSRKFTPDAANEGIQGDDFTTTTNAWYTCTCHVFPDDGTTVRIRVRCGDDSDWVYNTLHESLIEDSWNIITFTYQETAGGSGAYIVFESDTATSGDYYIDDIILQNSVTATNWGIVPPDQTMAGTEGDAGNPSGTYTYAFTYKNSITGTRSNPTYLSADEDSRLLLHMEGATTSFSDSSGYSHTVTAGGDATQTTDQAKFGSKSADMSGDNTYLDITAATTLNPGSDRMTLDFWFRLDTLERFVYFFFGGTNSDVEAGYPRLMLGSQLYSPYFFIWARYYDAGGSAVFTLQNAISAITVYADVWHHVAFIRGWENDDNQIALTFDGTAVDTDTYDGGIQIEKIRFGHSTTTASQQWDGWLDEAHYVIGKAVFTGDFSPPSNDYSIGAITVSSKEIDFTDLPSSDDPQVDTLEIWRTTDSGTDHYYLASVANGTTTYTDNAADANLSSTALPTDNLKPYAWFDDCFGPYNASMFWITRTQSGERGRLFYSPVGRAEAVAGYINVCNDDSPLQKGVLWGGNLFVFGTDGLYNVYGTNPYYSRKVSGVPGTQYPHTVVVTPYGIMYQAEDGVRLFDGSTSVSCVLGSLEYVFRGMAAGQLTSFSGIVATFAREEYLISDQSQLLAYSPAERRWRDVGLAVKSLHYAVTADQIGAGTASDGVYDLEKESTTSDNSNAMSLALETPHVRLGVDQGGVVKFLHIDADTSEETLTAYIMLDGSATSLGTFSTAARATTTFPINKIAETAGVRITGSVDAEVIIYDIYLDTHIRGEETI